MRISDWSSDVCSSDLAQHVAENPARRQILLIERDLFDVSRRALNQQMRLVETGFIDQQGPEAGVGLGGFGRLHPQPEPVSESQFFIVAAVIECPQKSEEHTSELQSLMRISYAVFCMKKKNTQ